jgi:hypothetical protein
VHLKRFLCAGALAIGARFAVAQAWGVGATIGVVNDVGRSFHLDEFKPRDVAGWVEYRLEDQVALRGTFGSLKVKGVNAGQTAAVDGGAVELPDLKSRMDYGTVGVSYEFWEGVYTSGLFAGIGGYKIRPETSASEFETFRDPSETVFGWHVGVDGSFRIVSRLSLLGRITYHNVRATSTRSILSAGAGLVYRF